MEDKDKMFRMIQAKGNVLNAPADGPIVHCISADLKLGAGVAKQIDEKFGTRRQLLTLYPFGLAEDFKNRRNLCVATPRVLNLVTKEKYFFKPSYQTMSNAIQALYEYCMKNNITKLYMPRIGCGLDQLKWSLVEDIITEIFNDNHPNNVMITVYHLGD